MSKQKKNKKPDYSKKRSQFSITWSRLVRHKGAMIGLFIIAILLITIILADVLAPYEYYKQDATNMFAPMSAAHPFGTDRYGRDMLSRVIFGARFSIPISIAATLISALIGSVLGAIAGYKGGTVDFLLMRFLDIYQSIPALVLCLSMSLVLGKGVFPTILALSVSGFGAYARILRGSVMQVRENEYIEASKAVGGSNRHIILKHIIPNSIAPVIVTITMGVGSNIIAIASLGFIGMGLPTNIPDWGAMLSEGRTYMNLFPNLVLVPGFAIMITVLAFNLFGDGLRDALDPRLKD